MLPPRTNPSDPSVGKTVFISELETYSWRSKFSTDDLQVLDRMVGSIKRSRLSEELKRKKLEVIFQMYEISHAFEKKFQDYQHRISIKRFGKINLPKISISPMFRSDLDFSFTEQGKGFFIPDPLIEHGEIYMDLPLGFSVKLTNEKGETSIVCATSFAIVPDLFIYTNQIQGDANDTSKRITNNFDYVKFNINMLEEIGRALGVKQILLERSSANEWEKVKEKSPNHPVYDLKAKALGFVDDPNNRVHESLSFGSAPRIKKLV